MTPGPFNPAIPSYFPCPQCGQPLAYGTLVCANCGSLVYRQRLNELAAEASRLESINPLLAAHVWRQALALLPPGSPPFQQVAARAQQLGAAMFGGGGGLAPPVPGATGGYPEVRQSTDTWLSVLIKTGGSMALSTAVYAYAMHGPLAWPFAIGFTLLMLVHELGHSLANWFYGIPQSPPIFLPYVGAVILLKRNPPNALVESVIGIAGPVTGTLGAAACYGLFLLTGNDLYVLLAAAAVLLNLFNMIPCPPMDGGRVAAAITPFLWLPGLCVFGLLIAADVMHGSMAALIIGFLILRGAVPRVVQTLRTGSWRNPYYRIGGPARVGITVAYVLLTGVLLFMLVQLSDVMRAIVSY